MIIYPHYGLKTLPFHVFPDLLKKKESIENFIQKETEHAGKSF